MWQIEYFIFSQDPRKIEIWSIYFYKKKILKSLLKWPTRSSLANLNSSENTKGHAGLLWAGSYIEIRIFRILPKASGPYHNLI